MDSPPTSSIIHRHFFPNLCFHSISNASFDAQPRVSNASFDTQSRVSNASFQIMSAIKYPTQALTQENLRALTLSDIPSFDDFVYALSPGRENDGLNICSL